MAGTTRLAPDGTMLEDGYSTKIAFADDANIEFWERSVTPPGVDAGDAIEISTMHNVSWRTFAGKKLKSLTNGSITCAYDPKVYDSIVAIAGTNQEITAHFPDGSILVFWGFLKSFTPNENSEGSLPEATVEIVPTNRNAAGTETAPDYRSSATATP